MYDKFRNYHTAESVDIAEFEVHDFEVAADRCSSAGYGNTTTVALDEPAPIIEGVAWVELENHIPDFVKVKAVPEEAL